jgi:dTDP-glucose 4,6-dehydratase
MSQKLLVTGGMGFIGSNFILHMLNCHPHIKVINLDALTYAGNPDNLLSIKNHPQHQFVHGSINDQLLLQELFGSGIDIVVHFAAESHVDRSIEAPRQFIETNVQGTQNILEAARQHGVERFVHISTDEVYGSLGNSGYFNEGSPLAPNSPYSASKASADMLVRAYHRTYGLPAIITRCTNNYGPRQFPEKLIPLILLKAVKNEKIPVYGDGLNVRDWLYVGDHCAAIDLVIQKGLPGEVYNIGGHNEFSNIKTISMILEELGKPASLIEYVPDRLGHDRRYAIDPAKIEGLGWRQKTAFEEGIQKTIDWYMRHPEWIERAVSRNRLKQSHRSSRGEFK